MVDDENPRHDHELISRLAGLGFCRGSVPIEPLTGGITNRNFRVETERGTLVARVCRELPLLGIDRRSEAAAQNAAARLGLAPELIHHEQGLLVSRHLSGRTLAAADLQDIGLITHVGSALRRLHDARDVISGHLVYFCPFQTIRTYARSAAELGARLPQGIDALLEDARSLLRRIGPFLPALCHNDLLPSNLIWSDGRLWLIDWEYAGMGHPLFDLASVSANAGFTDFQEKALLEAYHGVINPQELEEIRTFKLASALREALWAMVQSVVSELSFDYLGYASRNFETYRKWREQLPG
jgi:thiamine kinase-like enzyme